MDIFVLTIRMFVRDKFHYNVFIIHIYRSVICSSTQLLILLLVALIVSPFDFKIVRLVTYPIADLSNH